MTDLEDRIRDALDDPRRDLVAWPDPMARIRRAERRQRTAFLVAGVALALAIVTPLAVLSRPAGRPTKPPRPSPIAHRTPAPPPPRTSWFAPAAAFRPVPPWAKGLGGEVAYTCGENACLMRPDGRGSRVMAVTVPEMDLAWSPDGRYLSFRGYYATGDGTYDLYAVGLKGCNLTRLTHQMNGTSSSWSPDGRQLAFSTPEQIDVINANGTGLRRLVSGTTRYSYGVDMPAWSVRDKIAYTLLQPPHGRPEIYTINPDGTGNAPLTYGAPGYAEPSWSPDGGSIAFTANPYAAGSSIVVASATGAGAHPVSPAGWTSYSPTWTPGGKIVFLRQTGPSTQTMGAPTSAYIVNPDGTGLRLLYRNLDASEIDWGPGTLPATLCYARGPQAHADS